MPYSDKGHVPHPERKNQARDYINLIRSTNPCHFCGEEDPAALEFHHVNPEDKSFNVSNSWRYKGLQRIKNEIAKCVVICANCHRKVHAGILSVEEKK